MKEIYIIGSGGAALDVFWAITSDNSQQYELKGFVDISNQQTCFIGKKQYTIFNESDFLKSNKLSNCVLALGVGEPKLIQEIISKYPVEKFENIIHSRAIIDRDSLIMGNGNFISAGSVVNVSVELGSFNYVGANVTIGHNCQIGNGNLINPGAVISGKVKIENHNLVGAHSTILQNLNIKSTIVIGANALVSKDLTKPGVYVGIPARELIKEIK